MIKGALATIYVSDMDRAVDFYTRVLGLRLAARYGDEWASIDAGGGSMISLHPQSDRGPVPGTRGSICVGLGVTQPLDDVIQRLKGEGVQFRGPVQGDPKAEIRLAAFGDPDGNDLYLSDTSV